MKLIAAAFILFLGFSSFVTAEEPHPHSLMLSQTHEFQSSILEEDITILIGLPFNYQPESMTYPIVFHTDGDVMFSMGTEILRLMSFERSAPPVISVGVSYGGFPEWLAARARDYHPSASDPNKEGVAKFLRVLEEEVIPFVRENYATSENGHVLYGHSSGGLLALYAALSESTSFDFILASSPSVEEEPEWIEQLLHEAGADTAKAIFISLGEAETKTRPLLDSFVNELSAKSARNNIRYVIIPDMPHMAVIPPAYAAGMKYLFGVE
ncbi:MAG: alpha/beta hydrolase-fold protein [Pseudomonadota bacterium]